MNPTQFQVTGMTCSACSSHVERTVRALPGVEEVAVSLLTNSMQVRYASPATADGICRAVEQAGYGASVKGSAEKKAAPPTEQILPRLLCSAALLLPLLYVSMGHVMWGWPIPASATPMSIALYELLLTALILIINRRFFIKGYQSLRHGAPSMDTLVSMGAGAAFVYSTAITFAMAQMPNQGAALLHDLYFESAAMILTLITVGKLLEERSRGKTTDAIRSLMALAPETARVLRDGEEKLIPAEQLALDESFFVRPGERIPADGIVLEGESAVNEAALTGESLPVEKAPGSTVSAATLNQQGYLTCKATRVGENTTLQQIIALVEDAAATKAPIAKMADKVSGVFVPTVMAIALCTGVIWLLVGKPFSFALARAISVLVISCPCALGLATPVAIMAGNGVGARHGILFKTAAALEHTGRTQIIALDKTGTVTKGEPAVTDILPAKGVDRETLVRTACILEAGSEHPLARAIAALGSFGTPERFQALPGFGVKGIVDGKAALGGSMTLFKKEHLLTPDMEKTYKQLAGEGKTPLLFAWDSVPLGMIAVADVLREDSVQAIADLHTMGIQTVMLTGDNARTAEAIAKKAGVTRVISDVLPAQKEAAIRKLQASGIVTMVGDGINDAPALTRADTGIAIGAGTDVAIDAADVVLMKSSLTDVAAAIRLSRQTLRNIKENLFWAFFYNCIGIPIAAGILYPSLGLTLNPMLGAAAMSLSSFCVVSNALRLNLWSPLKIHHSRICGSCFRHTSQKSSGIHPVFPAVFVASDEKKPRSSTCAEFLEPPLCKSYRNSKKYNRKPISLAESEQEEKPMKKTFYIEGMMCMHCVAHVKKALEAIEGVNEVEVSLEAGNAAVTMREEIPDSVFVQAITDAGYSVTRIEA